MTRSIIALCLQLSYVLLSLPCINSAVFSGKVSSNDIGIAFLAKFVFDYNPAKIDGGFSPRPPSGEISVSLKMDPHSASPDMQILLFDDQKESWPAIYQQDASCEKVRKSARNYHKFILHSPTRVRFDKNGKWSMNNVHIHEALRPRYWYIVADACGRGFRDLTYEVHLTNPGSNGWSKEFSVNERGLNTLYVMFFLLYCGLVSLHIFGSIRLRKVLGYTPPLPIMFLFVLLLQFSVVGVRTFHFLVYTVDGIGLPKTNGIAEVVDKMVRSLFMLILMLLAKGWCISHTHELESKQKVLLITGAFFFAEMMLLLFRGAVLDPAQVDIPFSLSMMLDIELLVWFAWGVWFASSIYRSWVEENSCEKKELYRNLALAYFPWFFGLPLITILTSVLNPWVREKVIISVSLFISTAAYAIFVFLLWPTRAETYFNLDTPSAKFATYDQL